MRRRFQAADPDGFLMGWIDGEPVAAIAAVRHSDGFGFIGLFIVREGWRGRGPRARDLGGGPGAASATARSGSTASPRRRRRYAARRLRGLAPDASGYHGAGRRRAGAGQVVPVRGRAPAGAARARRRGERRRAPRPTCAAWFARGADPPDAGARARRRASTATARSAAAARAPRSGRCTPPTARRGGASSRALAAHAPADGGVSLDVPEPNYAGDRPRPRPRPRAGVRDGADVPRARAGAGPCRGLRRGVAGARLTCPGPVLNRSARFR